MKHILLFVFGLLLCSTTGSQRNKEDKSPKVILITLDGLRWQELFGGADPQLIYNKEYVKDSADLSQHFWTENPEERRAKLMPFFWNTIAKEGQLYGNRKFDNKVNCTNKMWFSYPGYNEILSGFADDRRIWTNRKIPNPNQTVLEFINKQKGFEGKVAAFCSWDVFPYIINEQRSKVYVNAGFDKSDDEPLTQKEEFLNRMIEVTPSPWGSVRLDAFTHEYAMEYVKKHHPRMLYLSYGETDDFAHDGRYDHYLHAAKRTDAFIKEWWDFIQQDPYYRGNTTIVLTTDHGRGTQPLDTWKSHNNSIEGADEIWMAALGKGVKPLGEVKEPGQLHQNQVASTVASLLGLKYTNETEPGKAVETIIK